VGFNQTGADVGAVYQDLRQAQRFSVGVQVPVAALMLMAWYDRVRGYHRLIKPVPESDLVQPEALLLKLRREMKTANFELDRDGVQTYGLTLPAHFRSGLRSYIRQYYAVDVKTKASTGTNTLSGVFRKSRELLDEHTPHVLLLDYDEDVMGGTVGGLFPDHYVVVVGYSVHQGHEKLIVNNGNGHDFQVVDMTDKRIKPARIYWLDMKEEADGPKDGHRIGPETHYEWDVVDREKRLVPTILKHDSSTETFEWRAADRSVALTSRGDLGVSYWYD
jgi:hypothetical protein